METATSSRVLPKLPENWLREWEARNAMALFVADDGDFKIFAVNKETRQVYHVVDFLRPDHEFGGANNWPACSLLDGKLYLVGDLYPGDVHICDLTLSPPYSWKQGPPMHSSKDQHHLIPFHGLLFVIGNPDPVNMVSPFNRDDVVAHDPLKPVVASFEVLDTKKDDAQWEVLPDPPFTDYNNRNRCYTVVSYTVINHLIYFVFQKESDTDEPDFKYDGVDEDEETVDDVIYSKVLAFDPKRREWLTKAADYEPAFRWYIDLAALCTQGYNRMVHFVDPSLRCFLMDPPNSPSITSPIPPCFYTFDYSSWNHHPNFNPLPQALVQYAPWSPYFNQGYRFLKWFQIYLRPYLSPVVGLSDLMEALAYETYRHCHTFFLPSYHHSEQDGEHWSVCLVAFVSQPHCYSCVVATFKVVKTGFNRFEAKDLKVHVQDLTNISYPRSSKIIPKIYNIS